MARTDPLVSAWTSIGDRIRVVLPLTLGPSRPTIWPGAAREVIDLRISKRARLAARDRPRSSGGNSQQAQSLSKLTPPTFLVPFWMIQVGAVVVQLVNVNPAEGHEVT